jgi:hypothetical protein
VFPVSAFLTEKETKDEKNIKFKKRMLVIELPTQNDIPELTFQNIFLK